MWECLNKPKTLRSFLELARQGAQPQLPISWSLGDEACTGPPVTCLAATDQVIVNGFSNGALRIARMDTNVNQQAD